MSALSENARVGFLRALGTIQIHAWMLCCTVIAGIPLMAGEGAARSLLLKSDQVLHDYSTGVTTAKGNVLLFAGTETLQADIVAFDGKTNTVSASGNVRITQRASKPGQKEVVFFSNYAQLSSDLKEGFIGQVQALLSDNSKFSAASVRRHEGTLELQNARYSPCKVCQDKGTRATWQLSARRVTWLQDQQDLVYRDAAMHFWDVPVFYLPYLRHPDPSVKRRSGILVPTFGNSRKIGGFMQMPYFMALGSNQDLTVTPLLTTAGGGFLGTHYRFVSPHGSLTVKGSGGVGPAKRKSDPLFSPASVSQVRGHIDMEGAYALDSHWRVSVAGLCASDKTYLAQYPFYGHTRPGALASNLRLEGFYRDLYVRMKSQYTQSTYAADNQRNVPLILPRVDLSYQSRPGTAGWINLETHVLSLQRQAGDNMQRAITALRWSMPAAGLWGDRFLLTLSARGDLYRTAAWGPEMDGLSSQLGAQDTHGRFFPQAQLSWTFPFYWPGAQIGSFVTPELSLIVAPTHKNPDGFPNEDAHLGEPDDLSLFHFNRTQGYDRLDDGTRLSYGVRASLYRNRETDIEGFLGQSYHLNPPSAFLAGTGFDDHLSDVVGHINMSQGSRWRAQGRWRLDHHTLGLRRMELGLSASEGPVRGYVDYFYQPAGLVEERLQADDEPVARNQLQLGTVFRPYGNWRIKAGMLAAVGRSPQALAHKGSVSYRNSCLAVEFSMIRNYYINQDLLPDTTYWARMSFKNLGSFVSPKFGSAAAEKMDASQPASITID